MDKNDINNLASILMEKVGNTKAFNQPKMASGTGPEAAEGYEKKMEEYKDVGVEDGKPTEVKKKKNLKEENIMLKSSFDSLFKSTINEQDEMVDNEEVFEQEDESEGAEEGSEVETAEEVDVVTRLQMIINDLQNVVDELGSGEESEAEESGEEEEEEEETMGEAVSEPEPKELSDAGGMKLMGKGNIKVPGTLAKTSSGTAQGGKITSAPEPAQMSDAGGKKLMGKGAMKVASKVSAGKDLFNV